MVESHDPSTKLCPDCAETVLASARKCRFCGYRFDGAPSPGTDAGGGMFGGLRTRRETLTIEMQLARWGIELGEHEDARLHLCEVDGRAGYLVVTGERVLFVEPVRRPSRAVILWERPNRELTGVAVVRRRLRSRDLVIDWIGQRVVVSGLRPDDLRLLQGVLMGHVFATGDAGD